MALLANETGLVVSELEYLIWSVLFYGLAIWVVFFNLLVLISVPIHRVLRRRSANWFLFSISLGKLAQVPADWRLLINQEGHIIFLSLNQNVFIT